MRTFVAHLHTLGLIALFLFTGWFGLSWKTFPLHPASLFLTAHAERDDDEGESDDDNESSNSSSSSSSSSSSQTTMVKVTRYVTVYKPVTETITITPDDYQRDSDNDQLVDAIDPDPRVPQSEYFTDTDSDGVPDALDRHHDEDDFAYHDFETDDNHNGIIDSYEGLSH